MDDVTYMSRPWGEWFVLEKGIGYKVKRLEILHNQSISMQYHNHRSEIWTIVHGEGEVILNGKTFKVKVGDTFVVPIGASHKITCTSKETLTAIEVQVGEITEESDIVRL